MFPVMRLEPEKEACQHVAGADAVFAAVGGQAVVEGCKRSRNPGINWKSFLCIK